MHLVTLSSNVTDFLITDGVVEIDKVLIPVLCDFSGASATWVSCSLGSALLWVNESSSAGTDSH